MAVVIQQCSMVVCDGCDEKMTRGGDYIVHFGPGDLIDMEDWLVTDDGRDYCPDCVGYMEFEDATGDPAIPEAGWRPQP